MITEDYVSFETAKLLKEKGFQAKCTACYHSDSSHTFELVSGRINYCNPRFSKCKMIPPYNAPTLQMAMKWLREVHNIAIGITFRRPHRILWEIYKNEDFIIGADSPLSYEDVCNEAIKCALNLI